MGLFDDKIRIAVGLVGHEWWASGQHLIENAAKTVHVRSVIDLPGPIDLLGTHVVWCSDRCTGPRAPVLSHNESNPEIGQKWMARTVNQNIGRLHVTVDYATLVRIIQRGQHVIREFESSGNRQGPSA